MNLHFSTNDSGKVWLLTGFLSSCNPALEPDFSYTVYP